MVVLTREYGPGSNESPGLTPGRLHASGMVTSNRANQCSYSAYRSAYCSSYYIILGRMYLEILPDLKTKALNEGSTLHPSHMPYTDRPFQIPSQDCWMESCIWGTPGFVYFQRDHYMVKALLKGQYVVRRWLWVTGWSGTGGAGCLRSTRKDRKMLAGANSRESYLSSSGVPAYHFHCPRYYHYLAAATPLPPSPAVTIIVNSGSAGLT